MCPTFVVFLNALLVVSLLGHVDIFAQENGESYLFISSTFYIPVQW